MPKDTRTIVRGIQIPEGATLRTYAPGEEDQLEEVLTPAQVKNLTESGALTGSWSGKAKTAATLNPPNRKEPTPQELSQAEPRTHEGEPVKEDTPKPHAKHK
jgi:hypothetical protein